MVYGPACRVGAHPLQGGAHYTGVQGALSKICSYALRYQWNLTLLLSISAIESDMQYNLRSLIKFSGYIVTTLDRCGLHVCKLL